MNGFLKIAAVAGLALGAGYVVPAGAATLCDTSGYCVTGNGYYNSDRRPSRYACDVDGDNCHWTRSYYYDDDGAPVFDPSMTYP